MTTAAIASSLRAIYLREDTLATYISCGFCTSYRAIDPTFMALHMLQRHESELVNAPAISHNTIPGYYNLETRAIFIVDLIQRRNLRAGWLKLRK